MNNLVAYDADSDEDSPRRRSTEETSSTWAKEELSDSKSEERKRRSSEVFDDDADYSPKSQNSDNSNSNFAEPPPPKRAVDRSPSPAGIRTPQLNMPHTSSQASLVSYSGEGDDEEGEESIKNELAEPAPPPRQSQNDDSDEDERLIDLALEEGKAALTKAAEESSPAGSDTPGREGSIDSRNGNDQDHTPRSNDETEGEITDNAEIRIPLPPDVEVCERLQAKFEAAFRQKSIGVNLNQQMQSRQDFSNPMSYERFIELFEINEKGTNFSKNIFDPTCFPENCFYDKLAEEQKKIMEAQNLANAKKVAK